MTSTSPFRIFQMEAAAARKAADAKLDEFFDDFLPKYFADHPEVLGFCWTQYAPYFNDGEPCEFSIDEVSLMLTENVVNSGFEGRVESHDDFIEAEPRDYGFGYWNDDSLDNDQIGMIKFIQGLPDEYAQARFGEHSLVYLSRWDTTIEDYDHD